MGADRETLLKTAIAFSKSYDEWTVEGALRVRSADCMHQLHPASMNRPCMSNDDLAAYLASINRLFQNYRVHVAEDETVVDVEKRTVVMHAHGTADTILGPFRNEYMFILRMTESGEQIERIDEFVDSLAVLDLVPRIKEEWAKKADTHSS